MSKRYELMNKEDIIDFFSSSWDHDIVTIKSYLNEEIKTKKVCRYQLIQSPHDLDIMLYECHLKYGKEFDPWWFKEYLKEEIEVEE